MPSPSADDVRTIGVRRSPGAASTIDCSCRASRSAFGRSRLLTTSTSAISMIPAFIACTSSPDPGVSTTTVVSAIAATSTSSCPAPTVSTSTTSFPNASSAVTRPAVAGASPPRFPRVAIDRRNTWGSDVRSCMRMRSPSSAPWLKGLVGSMATIPSVLPRRRNSRASAPTSVLFPDPADPVRPTVCARPERGYSAASARRPSGVSFSISVRMRDRARRLPSRMRSTSASTSDTSLRAVLTRGVPLADEADHVLGGGPGPEDRAEPHLLQRLDIGVRDDAAREQQHLPRVDVALLERIDHAREQLHVRAREDAQPDDVHVLLQRRLGDHLRRLADAGVDDLHPGIAERARDDLRAAVVAVEPRLGDEHAQLAVCHGEGMISDAIGWRNAPWSSPAGGTRTHERGARDGLALPELSRASAATTP